MKTHPNITRVDGFAVVCDDCDRWIEDPLPLHLEAQLVLSDHTRPDGCVRCERCEWVRLNPAAVAKGRAAAVKLNAGVKP